MDGSIDSNEDEAEVLRGRIGRLERLLQRTASMIPSTLRLGNNEDWMDLQDAIWAEVGEGVGG